MKTYLSAAAIGLLLAMAGCQTGTVTPISATATVKMLRTGSVYIVTPVNGNYGDKLYEGSGSAVASAFDSALSKYSDNVIVGPYCDTPVAALEAAKAKQCTYVVIPKITHWEDRATEWSGIRDKMELFVKILNVADGTEVRRVEITGKSRWMSFGGDHPQDLLKDPVEELVESLYEK